MYQGKRLEYSSLSVAVSTESRAIILASVSAFCLGDLAITNLLTLHQLWPSCIHFSQGSQVFVKKLDQVSHFTLKVLKDAKERFQLRAILEDLYKMTRNIFFWWRHLENTRPLLY